jgi:hypothetical protein
MNEPPATPAADFEALLAKHGIIRIPADVFAFGGYRYSSAQEAIAAAERSARTANDA